MKLNPARRRRRFENTLRIERKASCWIGRFQAMASPCEIFLETDDEPLAACLLEDAYRETARIEGKLSRYRDDNTVHRINSAGGQAVEVDEETAGLIDFSVRCHEMSDGLFDITSGVLRRVWTFDGSARVPSRRSVEEILPLVGWRQVEWDGKRIRLKPGMEIDLGGIGKEYAVDRVHGLLRAKMPGRILVNFGGDLMASEGEKTKEAWRIGIEDPARDYRAVKNLKVRRGGLATSGDARRFLLQDGRRLGHVLNPKTGWPVEGAPRSVTVAAENCTTAGILSTMALLNGKKAEDFLREQEVKYWCVW